MTCLEAYHTGRVQLKERKSIGYASSIVANSKGDQWKSLL